MHCDILNKLYIRANGDVPCYDDAGEKIILGNTDDEGGIAAVLDNDRFRRIRSRLEGARAPWPGTCETCAFFRINTLSSTVAGTKRIRILQLEPTLACNLRCPCCSNAEQVRTRPRPLVLAPHRWERTLGELKDGGYTVDEIEYCGQGEPLLHSRFPEIARISREVFPGARQRLITNGNFEYWKSTGGVAIDELYVSCDGVRQQSYEKYRVGGAVSLPLAFLGDAPPQIEGRTQRRVWKYVLFEFNDSDEELLAAQEEAQRLKIDLLLFVVTHSRYRSRRYNDETIDELPLRYSNVMTSMTPIMERDARELTPLGSWTVDRRSAIPPFVAVVDSIAVMDSHLLIRGWALSSQAPNALDVAWDAKPVGAARTGMSRQDVFRHAPEFQDTRSGFAFKGGAGNLDAGIHVATLDFRYAGRRTERVEVAAWQTVGGPALEPSGEKPLWAAVYRLLNLLTGKYVLTTSLEQYQHLLFQGGWGGEGVAFHVLKRGVVADGVAASPVYHLHNTVEDADIWTTDVVELATLTASGWSHQGMDGYVFARRVTIAEAPLFRFFSMERGHLLTLDAAAVARMGPTWMAEGIMGFVQRGPHPAWPVPERVKRSQVTAAPK